MDNQKYKSLEVKKSKIIGNGMFALENIVAGEVICPFEGIVYVYENGVFSLNSCQLTDEIAIEPTNEVRYLNHSCAPNAYIDHMWHIRAIKHITFGEEITMDYATADCFAYSFLCLCGSTSCRKTFRGNLCKDPEYRTQNGQYFTKYVLSKIEETAK